MTCLNNIRYRLRNSEVCRSFLKHPTIITECKIRIYICTALPSDVTKKEGQTEISCP